MEPDVNPETIDHCVATDYTADTTSSLKQTCDESVSQFVSFGQRSQLLLLLMGE